MLESRCGELSLATEDDRHASVESTSWDVSSSSYESSSTGRAITLEDVYDNFPGLRERYTFRDEEPIGRPGGFGVVWKAHDHWLKRDVAIKVSRDDLSNEVILCRSIEGQTVRVFDYFRGESGFEAYAMELLGKPWVCLSRLIAERDYRPGDARHYLKSLEILYDTLYAMLDVHGEPWAKSGRFIHSDIKPDNMFVIPDGSRRAGSPLWNDRDGGIVKLIDFGMGRSQGQEVKGGTYGYLRPGSSTARAGNDLYAIGVTFLKLLVGVMPSAVDLQNVSRIRRFIARCGSGSSYLDEAAAVLANHCVRAEARRSSSAVTTIGLVEEWVFDLNSLLLKSLLYLHEHVQQPLKKADLAEALFPVFARDYGWDRRSAARLEHIKGALDVMVEKQLLIKQEGTLSYWIC